MPLTPCFTPFRFLVSTLDLPEKFTFPFYYTPHRLSLLAAEELQLFLKEQHELNHNFGLGNQDDEEAIGKMFGVLVVQNDLGELGYLSAYSGVLTNNERHSKFVPPLVQIEERERLIAQEMTLINQLGAEVKNVSDNSNFLESLEELEKITKESEVEIAAKKKENKSNKKARKERRTLAEKELSSEAFEKLKLELVDESYKDQFYLKHLVENWNSKVKQVQKQVDEFENELKRLKEERKHKSNLLQEALNNQYVFLNIKGKEKSLRDIFTDFGLEQIPSGSGDCAAPRLLQYAFKHGYKPIAMAEFWWGASPKSAIRKHGVYYPSCSGKCEPILKHMLQGMDVDPNPLLSNLGENTVIETLYEDDVMLIINKPADLLSVPGKIAEDSVYLRMKHLFPKATGPLLVHRLDQSTSGIMLIAKTKEAHKYLQHQFIQKTISKTYVALLDGIVTDDKGTIDLPLRVDLDNRPNQLVCYEHGKKALTHWEVLERKEGRTKIHFFPVTGRTHQLRVHAAHPLGLNIAIVGDDLYGTKEDRLHLHAKSIRFNHPTTHKEMSYVLEPEF